MDYRKLQFGDLTDENIGMEQVRVDIRNKASRYVIYTIYNSIVNTNNVKFVSQNPGITETALKTMIGNIRRFGAANIFGDYDVVSQLNGFLAYQSVVPVSGAVSQTAMDEIRRTGLLGTFQGAVVHEIKNEFNLTRPLPTGDGFELYFPNNILFVIPAGMQSPVRTWSRGGLTSAQALDVATGKNLVRFDLEIAADVGKSEEYKVGMIIDSSLGTITDPRA